MANIKQTLQTVSALGAEDELLLPHIELHAEKSAVIDGCRGIVSYDESKVCLHCDRLLLTIEGDALCLEHLSGDHISVSGTITALQFASL